MRSPESFLQYFVFTVQHWQRAYMSAYDPGARSLLNCRHSDGSNLQLDCTQRAHLLIRPASGESRHQCVSELCQRESTKRSEVGPAINRLQPKFTFSARDIISLAGLARGPSSVSLRFSQARRICFVTDTHLVYSSAMSLGNLSIETRERRVFD